jgi:hypothetical protein
MIPAQSDQFGDAQAMPIGKETLGQSCGDSELAAYQVAPDKVTGGLIEILKKRWLIPLFHIFA